VRCADTLSPRQSVANSNDSMMFAVRQVVKSPQVRVPGEDRCITTQPEGGTRWIQPAIAYATHIVFSRQAMLRRVRTSGLHWCVLPTRRTGSSQIHCVANRARRHQREPAAMGSRWWRRAFTTTSTIQASIHTMTAAAPAWAAGAWHTYLAATLYDAWQWGRAPTGHAAMHRPHARQWYEAACSWTPHGTNTATQAG